MTSPRDCQCPRVRHHHGTDAAYDRDNCRCLPCRLAHSRDHAAYRAGRKPGRPSRLVDSTGTRRRIEALAVMGHSSGAIASQIGCSPNAVRKLRYGDTVNVTTAEKITTVYDRLAMTRCTSRDGKNSRTLALRAGCLGPLAWDDDTIDDPAASPASPEDHTSELDEVAISEAMAGRLVHLTRRERTEAVRRLTEQGLSAADIGDRLHITGRTVVRRRTAA